MSETTREKIQAAFDGLERADKNGDMSTWLLCHIRTIRSVLQAALAEKVVTVDEFMKDCDIDPNFRDLVQSFFKNCDEAGYKITRNTQ